MLMRNYLILCAAVTVVTIISILFVPGLADMIEGRLLAFLSGSVVS